MLTTFRENFREGWTVRWSKRGKIFCYFSLTTTFLFILIFFGFLNCIYQAFTTDFYLLSFSLTTLYQLLKLHLVVRCQNHGLMNLWIIIETVKLLIVRITFETKTVEKSKMSTALLYSVLKWDETENWAGVARNWSWREQEAGFFVNCRLFLHLQGYKGLWTRNLWWTDRSSKFKLFKFSY